MTWKNFFKPTVAKIILLVFLFLIFSYFFMQFAPILPDATPKFGAPIAFYSKATHSFGVKLDRPIVYLDVISLIIDLVVWYFVSCIIIFYFGIMGGGVKQHHAQKKLKNKNMKKRKR